MKNTWVQNRARPELLLWLATVIFSTLIGVGTEAWISPPKVASPRRWAAVSPSSSSRMEEEQEKMTSTPPPHQASALSVLSLSPEQQAEQDFKQRTAQLCRERNLPLQKVKNARDLASVRNSPVQPGRIYRMGRLSDATTEDIQLLMSQLNIRTLIDLRSPTELKDDPTLMRPQVFGNFTNWVWKERGRGKDGCLKALAAGEPPVQPRKKWWTRVRSSWPFRRPAASSNTLLLTTTTSEEDDDDDPDQELVVELIKEEDDVEADELCNLDCADPQAVWTANTAPTQERYFVSLMNELKYVRGTVSRLRKRDLTKTLLKSPGALVSRRVRASVKKPFLKKINDGGLNMLNELLFRYGAPGIKFVLELCADRQHHPVAFYCTAGKDRTGALAAIILGLCGVSVDDIVEDYSLSANVYAEMNDHSAMVGALSQRNLDPRTFLGAPPQVMRDTLAAIQKEYGSVEGYCQWIGFGPELQQKLREACMN